MAETTASEPRRPTLLAVFAHPDDESYAAGGTLAKYARAGARVALLCATRGEAGITGVAPEEAAKIREQELWDACAVLGISEVSFLDYRDGELIKVAPDEATARIARVMREVRPQVVVTFGPDGISGHPDHIAIGRLTTAAFDAVVREGFLRRLYYVAPSAATEQSCGAPAGEDVNSLVGIDIELFREIKVQATQCHRSQEQYFPGPAGEEAQRLACHEFFRLARGPDLPEDDLFGALE